MAIARHGTLSHHGSVRDPREISYVDWRSVLPALDDDVLYVPEVLDEPLPANVERLAASFDVGPAGVRIVLLQGFEDLTDSDPEASQLVGI